MFVWGEQRAKLYKFLPAGMCDVFGGHENHILAEAKNSRKQYWTLSKNHIVKGVILDF